MGATGSRTLSTSSEARFIQQLVQDNCVVIFSKTTCGYCRMAKRVFDDIGMPYQAVELNQRQDGHQIQDELNKLTGSTTVPRVFVNGTCIGGGTETKKLQESGKLLPLLDKCQIGGGAS